MCYLPSRSALALVALAVFTTFASAQEKAYSRRTPVTEAVQKTKHAIVAVKTARPGGGKDMVGTGVIIDERGYVITNRHVVGSSKVTKVCLHDGTELAADVLVGETAFDLAVLRIKTDKKLQALELAPVADLMVGEAVIAVGHPYGYINTVSTGIVSALEREITMPSGDVLSGLIQTNASINPGNSGGPLLNINGELIGINVALRDGAQNIAFAINTESVKRFLNKHFSAGQLAGVQHGLQYKETIVGETGDRQRVVVAGVQGNPELVKGDEIIAVSGRMVGNSFDLERSMWDTKAGQTVQVTVVRSGATLEVNLTLAAGNGAGSMAALIPTHASTESATRTR